MINQNGMGSTDYDYWNNNQDPVYPIQQPTQQQSIYQPTKEDTFLETLRGVQQSIQQSIEQSRRSQSAPLPDLSQLGQGAIALPGSGLTVTVETSSAVLRITFESKS